MADDPTDDVDDGSEEPVPAADDGEGKPGRVRLAFAWFMELIGWV